MLKYSKIKKITKRKLDKPTTVYNFHVPGNESYVANGVVTHNCYVQRRKGLTNPITVFTNIDEILKFTVDHARAQGTKEIPNQCDPHLWTYDIGENCDCSVDDLVSDNVQKFIETFRSLPNSKACFATKFVNRNLLNYDPQGHTRIRFSVMPQRVSSMIDVRTSPMQDRIEALNDFVDAGYEVHLNVSPVIVYKQDGHDWRDDYRELFQQINDCTNQKFKDQAKSEVIFMTHNEDMHDLNLKWHPKAEDYLWKPDWQEQKCSQTGGKNLRYQYQIKRKMIDAYKQIHQEMVPYMDIRYIF